MSCNPCCCSLKDSAVTIGIWSVVYSGASLALFSWQTYVLNNCRAVVMAQSNLQCEWDCPCVGASTARTTAIIEGLFIIQVLCLISVFFLLFAAVAMIWGVHTWSRYLIMPWFPCMVCSILSSLAYCIMWWAGDVRDYWLAITIIEIIGVFINIYCVVVVMMYYRRIEAATNQYEGKTRGSRRGSRRPYHSRRDLLDDRDYPPTIVDQRKSPYPGRTPYPQQQNFNQPMHQPYPSPYSPAGVPQTPLPLPPSYTPYPPDMNELMSYQREPKKQASYEEEEEDPVKRWVHTQQKLDRGEANSEPISPTRGEDKGGFPIHHSRSVPSMVGQGSLVSHRDCEHGKSRDKHRSSSRRRSKSRHRNRSRSSSSERGTRTDADRKHRSSSRHRHRSQSRYSESEITATTDHRRHRDRERERDRDRDRERDHRHHRDDDSRRSKRKKSRERRRDDDDGRDSKRKHRHRHREDDEDRRERRRERDGEDDRRVLAETAPESQFPLSGGLVVPQHIVIPPSSGERGPDGQPLPQKFQINSEITINYDQNATQQSSGGGSIPEPYRRHVQPMQITSNV